MCRPQMSAKSLRRATTHRSAPARARDPAAFSHGCHTDDWELGPDVRLAARSCLYAHRSTRGLNDAEQEGDSDGEGSTAPPGADEPAGLPRLWEVAQQDRDEARPRFLPGMCEEEEHGRRRCDGAQAAWLVR